MSSDALCRVMEAEQTGSPTRRLILIGMADNADPRGKGEASIADLQRLAEITEEQLMGELEKLRRFEAVLWMRHPEEEGSIVFGFRFGHPMFRKPE